MPKIEEIGFFCKLYLPRKNIFAIILPVVTAQVMMQKTFLGGWRNWLALRTVDPVVAGSNPVLLAIFQQVATHVAACFFCSQDSAHRFNRLWKHSSLSFWRSYRR